jgi:hypothetical protein
MLTFVTRHVVDTAKLYKYRQGVRLRTAKCDTGQRNVWLLIKSGLVVAFPQLVYIWKAHTRPCGQPASFGTSGQAREPWERSHNDKANIWPVYQSTSVRQNKPVVGTASLSQLHTWLLVHICQIHDGWERGSISAENRWT